VFGVDLSPFFLLEVGFDLFCWLFGHCVSGDGNNLGSGFFFLFSLSGQRSSHLGFEHIRMAGDIHRDAGRLHGHQAGWRVE
jgi:hypothetical protein